jgi:signal transduction histidine kinase
MHFLRNAKFSWPNTSIATRLYFVVGIMGLLIVLELVTLRFAMGKLSAVRAFVGGESLWSKAQKNAVFRLQRFGVTKDEKDYEAFLMYLQIPEGDREARRELFKPNPDMKVVHQGFLKGHIHPDDIPPMVHLLQNFYWVKQLKTALDVWANADFVLAELIDAAKQYHDAIKKGQTTKANVIMDRIKAINEDLTFLEENFSNALGEGSRYLEGLVLFLLTIAVITVEAVGLGLAFLTSRGISRDLNGLSQAAERIGSGDFSTVVQVNSKDEIGQLAMAVKSMGQMLKKSYGGLEAVVAERTAELSNLAQENARLYEQTSAALKRRDEFLSIASHELKTPITSMLLQAQLLLRVQDPSGQPERFLKFANLMERQLKRINQLVEEMLDTSRIDLSKLSLHLEKVDLSLLVKEICDRFQPQFTLANTPLACRIKDSVEGNFDSYRMEQVITNLLSNALKYAPATPVTVTLEKTDGEALLSVTDEGPGISPEDQEKIFNRFERSASVREITGLGIGLYISKAIVEAHGGQVRVESAPLKGAKFLVSIPLQGNGGA